MRSDPLGTIPIVRCVVDDLRHIQRMTTIGNVDPATTALQPDSSKGFDAGPLPEAPRRRSGQPRLLFIIIELGSARCVIGHRGTASPLVASSRRAAGSCDSWPREQAGLHGGDDQDRVAGLEHDRRGRD